MSVNLLLKSSLKTGVYQWTQFISHAPKLFNEEASEIHISREPCCSYSLRKLSSRAWRSASASLTVPGPPPPPTPPPPAAAATGVAFTPLAAKEPDACGKPDNWSVSWRPSSSSTCDTTASLKQENQLSSQRVKVWWRILVWWLSYI